MKQLFILIVLGLFFAAAVGAEESVLIDFTKLAADVTLGKSSAPNENGATLIDFATVAGASLTSLALQNWDVELASSARTVARQSLSFTKEAVTKATAKAYNGEEMANRKVLGVRINFPVESFNSWAKITPPFDIPAFADKDQLQGDKLVPIEAERGLGAKFENGFGVVKNVGIIKSISVTVYGSKFPNGFGIIITDQTGNEQIIFMDYLQFDGWRTLTWNNPNYVVDVRNRELRQYPLYPKSAPHIKISGLIVYRDAMQEGGDFITYVKDVKVVYDKADLSTERDINDEAIWGILQARMEARRLAELKRVGNLQVLRYVEKLKMDQGTSK
jgi:hypothetical protein